MALIALLVVALFGVATGVFDVQVVQSQALPYFYTLKIATRLVGTSTWRGSHSFSWRAPSQALFDTAYVKGVIPGDFVFVTRAKSRTDPGNLTEIYQLKGAATGLYGIASTDSIYVTRNDTLTRDSLYNYLIVR